MIKQEILAAVQQSEHKMDELIKRMQRTDSVSKYEAVIIRLQVSVLKGFDILQAFSPQK